MKATSTHDLTIVEKLRLEEEFFSQAFLMSYSGLNKLAYSPGAFYQHYILKQKSDPIEKSMIEGKAIHCLLLTPDIFEEQFIIMPEDIPSDNPKRVLDRVYEHVTNVYTDFHSDMEIGEVIAHSGFRNSIIDILVDENLYQTLKTDEQRLDKMLTERNLSYFIYLLRSGDRIVIDQQTYDFASRAVQSCKENEHLKMQLGMDHYFVPGNVHNELPLASFPDKYRFGLKGIIDNLVIDHESKVIRINDVKKSSKPLSSFHESIDYYKYWIQAAIYKQLVENQKDGFLAVPYPVEFRFVVIDPYMQVGIIKISDDTMQRWEEQTHDLLMVAQGHFDSRNFSLPLNFLTSENHEHIL
jgi:hypothetical protein